MCYAKVISEISSKSSSPIGCRIEGRFWLPIILIFLGSVECTSIYIYMWPTKTKQTKSIFRFYRSERRKWTEPECNIKTACTKKIDINAHCNVTRQEVHRGASRVDMLLYFIWSFAMAKVDFLITLSLSLLTSARCLPGWHAISCLMDWLLQTRNEEIITAEQQR